MTDAGKDISLSRSELRALYAYAVDVEEREREAYRSLCSAIQSVRRLKKALLRPQGLTEGGNVSINP